MGYAIVSPIRNERKYLHGFISSVCRQKVLPDYWIIIDDQSDDGSDLEMEALARRNERITFLRAKFSGKNGLEKGAAVRLFKFGTEQLKGKDVDFVAKVDGDVVLPRGYFASLLNCFDKDPTLGIASGVCFERRGLRYQMVPLGISTVWAACRIYRRKCLEDIGDLPEAPGWDTLDVLRARLSGWQVKAVDSARFYHLRQMGSRDEILLGKKRHGKIAWCLNYHPVYMAARCLFQVTQPPYFWGSLAMLVGYIGAAARREDRIVTDEEAQLLRSDQLSGLIKVILRRNLQSVVR